ncbi:MAG: glycosyltransferase, partial [Planctomycetota bacterium]|nr:glycosyltransferase [Planctomycetota bacterium]
MEETYDILTVSEGEGTDFQWACEKETFQEILNRLPEGWEPDLVIWLCHYNPIPEGIEHSPYPTVATVGDWNLLFTSFKDDLKRFDWIVTDKSGVEMLRRGGFENVDYWPMFAHDVYNHRRMENVERIYDVVMIGNFNHSIQRDRSHWLHRLAKLKNRFDIHLLCGIYGEDYTRLLNQAKIVFNRSIRGEMNMRAYEATACGALLFMEEDNLEINDFFKDRVECVLYNEDNLEELIEYYLTHDEERERIAEAGYQRVQQETQHHHFERLVELLQERNVLSNPGTKRSFLDLPEPQRLFRQARQAF